MNAFKEEILEGFKERFNRWGKEILGGRLSNGEIKPQFWTRHGQIERTKKEFRSGSGEYPIKEIYTPLDIAETDIAGQIGLPGEYPFTRGRDPLGPQAVNIPLKYYSGYGSTEEIKKRYQRLYQSGGKFIVLALDLPTQIGYDSDFPMAAGEVGKVGIALDTLADMEWLFEGLPLDKITTGTVGNSIGPWALAMFYLAGEKNGVDPSRMRVNLQNDPFKEYTGRGTFIFPPSVALDIASDTVAYICNNLSRHWEPQYYCTTTLRWGGCNVTQEVGFGIANLIAYIEAAQKKGIPPEILIPRTNLHMTADLDIFEEVAKFRATRRLWAKIASHRFGTNDPRVTSLRITVYTAANRLTAQQPLNNIIRVTAQVLTAMLGGVETISIPAYDEAHALPTEESTRLASLTPHILSDECMIGNTNDPLGGSYYIECLTDKIEEGASKCYRDVEAEGGALAAIEKGYYLRIMLDGLYKYQKEVENGKRKIIGLNKYILEKDQEIEIFKGDPGEEENQIKRLNKVRQERDNYMVKKCLNNLKIVAQNKANGKNDNIVPAMIEAVRSYASIGEIFDILRNVFGEYKSPGII